MRMRGLIASAVILATATPATSSGGTPETVPNGWSTSGPLTNETGIHTTPSEPEGAFSLAERPSSSPSPDLVKDEQEMSADGGNALPERLPSLPTTGRVQQERGHSEVQALGGVRTAFHPGKILRGSGAKILSLSLLVVAMAFIARVFSSKLALKGGRGASPAAHSQTEEGSPELEAERVIPEDGGRPLEQGAQPTVKTLPAEDGQSKQVDELVELENSISGMIDLFRRAALKAEMWANNSEGVLISGKGEGWDGPEAHSASRALLDKVSSIASSLAQNVGELCNGLDSASADIRRAETREHGAEAAARLRRLLRALDKIGSSAAVEFSRIAELTATMTSQAKTLLDAYPDILVLANSLTQPLPEPRSSILADPTLGAGPAGEASLADLQMAVDAVITADVIQQAKMQKLLRSSLIDPHFARLVQLMWTCREYQDEMRAAAKSVDYTQRSMAERTSPSSDFNVSAAIDMLRTIKAKQMALGEAMKLELDLCVEQALESLEGGRTLLGRRDDGRWRRNNHPLLVLARTIKKAIASVEVSLSKWEESARNKSA